MQLETSCTLILPPTEVFSGVSLSLSLSLSLSVESDIAGLASADVRHWGVLQKQHNVVEEQKERELKDPQTDTQTNDSSVTRLGDFWKFLLTYILTKIAQIFVHFGVIRTHSFWRWKIFGYLFRQLLAEFGQLKTPASGHTANMRKSTSKEKTESCWVWHFSRWMRWNKLEREREKSKIVYWNLHYHIYIQNVGPIHWKLYYRPYPLKTLVVYILSIGTKHAKHWLYTCKALVLYIATNFWYIYNTILISGQIHGRYVSNKLTISLGMIRYEPLHLLILILR